MRGKLRDKRADTKRDVLKREVIERRRTNKRENQPAVWQNQDQDPEEDLFEDDEEMLVEVPVKRAEKKK